VTYSLSISTLTAHSNSIRAIQRHLQRQAAERGTQERDMEGMIWLGDFNRHHPMWDELRNSHLFTRANQDKVQTLLDAIAEHDLHMVLPKEVPTLKAMATGNYSRGQPKSTKKLNCFWIPYLYLNIVFRHR
jgi:Endonuclease-reverse transcriptase